ncbi:hypothetical protein WR25_08592 isoform A [Diploscapter pachys]|uniref:Inositol-pentakisphosphate 2-kinase n=1 Tax=Diploscapter pachys TaxID=2018661 RepID=A0A2A2JLC2_9BILA|nr:hypothetical protein WR25_08592 isoform A [Diploscapter pachys]
MHQNGREGRRELNGMNGSIGSVGSAQSARSVGSSPKSVASRLTESNGSTSVPLIDPTEYRSFCFRGEGRMNFVISAKHANNGSRIVWRFAKARKSGLVTVKAKSELVNEYMEKIVSPCLSPNYLVNPKIIEMKVNDVHQLVKIPSLPPNKKIESFEELLQLPENLSFLPLVSIPKNVTRISALEMLDATRIPKELPEYVGPTITVEIKPKQGFFQTHPTINVPFCNNCILQMEKCQSDTFKQMYDFCPLQLFSGDFGRMRHALQSLIHIPHRNLRLFVDGNLIHYDEKTLEWGELNRALFDRMEQKLQEGDEPLKFGIDDILDALCLIISGSVSFESFALQPHSVLAQILKAQQIDSIGIVRAHCMLKQLADKQLNKLRDKTRIAKIGLQGVLALPEDDPLSELIKYFVAATMKDCSVMVSLRRIPDSSIDSTKLHGNDIIAMPNGSYFAYSVKVVDLDPKSPKNLTNAYTRFMAGVKLIEMNEIQRNPCI